MGIINSFINKQSNPNNRVNPFDGAKNSQGIANFNRGLNGATNAGPVAGATVAGPAAGAVYGAQLTNPRFSSKPTVGGDNYGVNKPFGAQDAIYNGIYNGQVNRVGGNVWLPA